MAFSALNACRGSIPAIEGAFSERPNLKKRVYDSIDKFPSLASVFGDIAAYVQELHEYAVVGDEGAVTKRRKLNGTEMNGLAKRPQTKEIQITGAMSSAWSSEPIAGISFSVPQRKKLLLQISSQKTEGIRALHPATKELEFGIPWKDIEHIVCLPVPEKAQPSWNYCVFPKYGDGVNSAPDGANSYEPIVWTVPEDKTKNTAESTPSWKDTITIAIQAHKPVLEPSTGEFFSQLPQVQRKGEKAYHIKAFRGSKDGFLFLLSTGIVWAFKKPLCFFAFDSIESISYTSVLQRTFNLNISTRASGAGDRGPDQEVEFSMVDQVDFAGIDAYVKRHGLQDASMAEQRRAKKLNINGLKGEEADGGGQRESELEKAAREADGQAAGAEDEGDEDEEDDENFDPGSEGESEGSGTSDEEDGEGGGEAEMGSVDEEGELETI